MLDDIALDVCAIAVEAYRLPQVYEAARAMGFGEYQSLVRSMLAIEIARQHAEGRHRLKDRLQCCP